MGLTSHKKGFTIHLSGFCLAKVIMVEAKIYLSADDLYHRAKQSGHHVGADALRAYRNAERHAEEAADQRRDPATRFLHSLPKIKG